MDKIIKQYATNSGLDVIKYFRLVLFSYLTGNNDMHLKNFSLMHTDKGVLFSPAYDKLNVNLIYPDDKEDWALTLGDRKRKIKRSDFDQFAMSLGLTEIVRDNIYKDFSKQLNKVHDLIESSFLTDEYKGGYVEIYESKLNQIGL